MLSKGERTKQKILEITSMLAAKEGFTSVSYQQIADKIDLSQAAVIKHFPSKSILFASVRELASQSNQKWVSQYVDNASLGKEKLFEYCFQNCIWAIKNKNHAQILLLGYYSSSTDNEMRKLNLKVWKGAEAKIESYLVQHYRDMNQDQPSDLEEKVRAIHAWVTGLAVRYFVEIRVLKDQEPIRLSIEKQLKDLV